MIEIRDVSPTGRELRMSWGLRRGWRSYALGAAAAIPQFGIIAMYWIASQAVDERAFSPLTLAFFGSLALPVVANWLLVPLMNAEDRRTPYGSQTFVWTLDEEGISQRGPLSSGQTFWAAIRTVREDGDRFVFLVSASGSPVLPKRQMTPDQIEAVRALVAEVRASGRMGRGVD